MLMDTLSINETVPLRSSVDISDKLPEDVLKYALKSDIDSGYKLMYYSPAYDGWLYLDFFEILQEDCKVVFHYKANTAIAYDGVIDRRSFEGWTTFIFEGSPKAEVEKAQ